MDIQAISILKKGKHTLAKLPDPALGDNKFVDFKTLVTKAIQDTCKDYKKVADYVERIKEELEGLGEIARKYNKLLSEKILRTFDSGLVKNVIPYTGNATTTEFSRHNFDKEKAQRILEMEKIAKQQQDLMEIIADMKNLINNVAELGTFTLGDIKLIENNVKLWAKSLETEEEIKQQEKKEEERREKERKAKERAEKLKELEERRQREEEERKRKEEEKRIAEEEKRRKDEEERRKREEERRKEEEEKRRKEEEERRRKEEEERKKEEEKRQKEEERKHKEEEEKRQREEEMKRAVAEKKRKEEEEKRRKEEEKRQEMERQRRNSENWPVFIYERSKDGKEFHKGICCVVSAIQGHGGLLKDDLCCTWSDGDDDLYGALRCKEEMIQSSLITVKFQGASDVTLDEPMRIYIPYNKSTKEREVKLKISVNDRGWESAQQLKMTYFEEIPKDIHLVGTTVNNFSTLQIAIISRPIRDNFIALVGGNSIEPPKDKNCKLVIPPNCFKEDTVVHIKTVGNVQNITKEAKELNNIKVATSLHGIQFDQALEKFARFQVYPDIQNVAVGSDHQKALARCNRKLVTDMSIANVVAELQKIGALSDKAVEDINSKDSEGERARRLLKEFKDCDNSQFEDLISALEKANQGHLVILLRKTMNDIKEEETLNDYLGPVVDGKLQIVSSQDYGDWQVMGTEKIQNIPDAVFVSLPKGGKSFEIIGLVVPKNMGQDDICRAAETIYSIVNQTVVRLLCKQNAKEPHEMLMHCVGSDRIDATFKKMKSLGFTEGPSESAEFGVCDGEDIFIRPAGNLQFDMADKQIKMKIFINMDSAKSDAYICPVNKKVQVTDKKYHGQLCYNIGITPESPPRSGSFIVFLPKEEQYQRYAPLSLNVSLKAMAKFLALKLSQKDGEKLREFYKAVAGTPALLRKLQNRVTKESQTGLQREQCELFVLNWANQRPRSEEKVKTLIVCLRGIDMETVAEAEKFHRHYQKGILSNTNLERLGNLIQDSWEELAEALSIDEDKIEGLKIDFQDEQRRAIAMLDQFRLSNIAIEHGGDVGHFILTSAQQAKCDDDVTKFIRENIK